MAVEQVTISSQLIVSDLDQCGPGVIIIWTPPAGNTINSIVANSGGSFSTIPSEITGKTIYGPDTWSAVLGQYTSIEKILDYTITFNGGAVLRTPKIKSSAG